MEKNKNHYAIIMAGGIGTRFWPYSRSSFPKQFIDILGIGKSLLQVTYERFLKNFEKDNIYIIANQAYFDLIKQQIPEIKDDCVLCEPIAKNTAACIAYASHKIQKANTHAVCVVAPSDHLIIDEDKFNENMNHALQYAKKNEALITLGIRPSRPDTGYGYIQFIEEKDSTDNVFKVKTFTEKPTIELAQTFVESGDFLWNAGIFIWSSSAIKNAFKEHMPEMYSLFKDASKHFSTPQEQKAIQAVYEQCRSISIDYGVMEKASNVFVIPADFGWSDLGTWTSLYENSMHDENNNVIQGKHVVVYDSKNSIIAQGNKKNNKLIVVKGIDNLIIVDTPDVLMVCNKNCEQEVKDMVMDINLKFDEKYT
ncbi:MAG: mannose-1-phosphate guanylyltransferase [Bacteroidota bacterium]